MTIEYLEEDKYQVSHDGKVDIMSLNEVMFLLATPVKEKVKGHYEELEEFWDSAPGYARM